jgi:hypothetical protein
MRKLNSWINTILLTIIICTAVWILYPQNKTIEPITTTTNPTTSTTVQFNVPMDQVHEYEQEKE